MTVKPTYSSFVMHSDIERELERLRAFGIDAQAEMLRPREFDLDYQPVAWFSKRDGVWIVRISPTATTDEHWYVLGRIWDAISHPDHSFWDKYEYGSGLWVGAPKDLARFNDGNERWRRNFEKLLSEKVSDLIRREMSKLTPETAGLLWLPYCTPLDAPPPERRIYREFLESHAEEVAAEIRAEMARQMRRVDDLAAVMNLSVPTVRKSLKGTRVLQHREIKTICDWLDVDVEDLLAKPYREAERAGLLWDGDDEA